MSNWILDYVKLVDQVSESPMAFNVWAAISVVSSVLKRNVWMNYKTFTIYPNQYIVLVAPPGIGKGAAIHPAHKFAKDAGLVNYMSDRVTAPRIIEKLFHGFSGTIAMQNGQVVLGAKDSSATLMSTELPTLLTSSEWMLQFLCDAWDRGEFDYDTRNKGSFTVTDMCVGLIGACVPDYIRKINKDAMATISSGFSSRTIFVNAMKKSKNLPWGEGFKSNPALIPVVQKLEARLRDISKLSGEFFLDPHARLLWDEFYEGLAKSASDDDSDVMKNFKSRQHVHVLKLAMTLTAAIDPSSVATAPNMITRTVLERAIDLIKNVADGVDDIFRGVGESDISAGIARLQLYLERKGTVSQAQLIKDNVRYINENDIGRVLKVLEMIGFMRVDINGTMPVFSHTGQALSN